MKKGILQEGDVLIVKDGATTGKAGIYSRSTPAAVNEHVFIFRAQDTIHPKYLYNVIRSEVFQSILAPYIKGIIGGISLEIKSIKIPLPPLEVQNEIVAELDGYQRVIDGARQVVANWNPRIRINPNWQLENLNDVCEKITDGTHKTPKYIDKGIPFLRVTDITKSNDSKKFISQKEHKELIKRCKPEEGDVLYSKNGTIGVAKLVDWDWEFSIFVSLALLKPKKDILLPKYLEVFMNSQNAYQQAIARKKSGTVTNLHLVDIKTIQIPLPSRDEQNRIIDEIKEEQQAIDSAKKLIEIHEQKIKNKIAEVWGE